MKIIVITFCIFALSIPLLRGANTVDVNETELDGEVKEMVWCGIASDASASSTQETVLILTHANTIYRSTNRGMSFTK